ncbi:NADP-dependent oxidoreductase [Streptomyces chumphonensis]|uniref:NADP-dependent oxidoreductase n=1 Tax=Streptomyces chumphonensis TaxID=1214925 RepID=A0A927EWN3_9ACTN|nr:NADP-dependent oxidoreductase [Streptomyces chumphonensis]MBD3931008.1 NADP-dependent oxidoreductase [Streptomyces chumphonensis]
MKAAVFHEFGGPEVLVTADVDIPEPGPGHVRVRVRAAGVQAYDAAVRGGWTPPGASITFPQIVGNDFAGTVDALGDDVGEFSVGDEVLGWAILCCYAEYLVVPTSQVVKKPATMPWEVAGAFSASAQTAHTALEALGVRAGDTFLVHAAAGGVGSVAVQLAKLRGAHVIGTASESNHAFLRDLGAVPIVYGDGLTSRVRAAAPQGVSVALDAVGGAALDTSVELIEDRKRIATLVDFGRVDELGVRAVFSQRDKSRLAELAEIYARGELRIEVSRTFPLDQAHEAHRLIETGHARGKTVITVA